MSKKKTKEQTIYHYEVFLVDNSTIEFDSEFDIREIWRQSLKRDCLVTYDGFEKILMPLTSIVKIVITLAYSEGPKTSQDTKDLKKPNSHKK